MKIYLIVFAGIFIISRIFSMILEHKFKRNINHTYYGSRSSKKRLIKRFNKKLKLEQKYQDKRQEKHNKKIMKMEQKNERKRQKREKSKIRKFIKFLKNK